MIKMKNKLSDEELVRRIKDGDKDCLDTLVKVHFPRVHNRINHLVPEYDVDDVTQEVFIGLMDSIYNFEERSAFTTWFHRITMNKVADYHRKSARRREEPNDNQNQQICNPWDVMDNELILEDLLRDIPSKYKNILILRHSDGLSFVEIAKKLKLSYEAARSRYRRAMLLIRKKVRDNMKKQAVIH